MGNAGRAHPWWALALFAMGFVLVFRGWLFSGFDSFFGDREDGYLALAIIEHWHHVFTGAAHWSDPIFFYPQRGTLGYTDAFFLFGLAQAPLRILGADTFTAYMFVMASLAALGFFGFYRLGLRYFGLLPPYAAVGAFIFAFGNVDAVKLIHAQSYCAMLLPGLCDLLLSAWHSKWCGAVLGALAGLLYAALFLTAFQTAWFFGCYVLLLMPLYPVFCGLTPTRSLVREMIVAKRPMIFAGACGFAIGIVPFLALYLPVLGAGHSREFTEVAANMPEWRDLANITPENAVWGAILRWMTLAGRPDGPVWEVELAFTPAVLVVFISGTVALGMRARRSREKCDPYLLMLAAAVIIFWLLQMDYFGFRPWHAIWALVPGGKAIRYPYRSQLVANLPVGLVVARALAIVVLRQSLAALLCGFLVIEQINLEWPPTTSRRATLAWIESVPPPPDGCQFFYVAPRVATAGGPSAPELQDAAMLFAEIRNVPTVNGYSSWFPDGWALDDPASPAYSVAVQDWAHRNDVERGLCALELRPGRWTPGLPQ